jgi:hypothetical protein
MIEFIENNVVVNTHRLRESSALPRIGEEVLLPGAGEVGTKSYRVIRVVHIFEKNPGEQIEAYASFTKVVVYLQRT